MSETSKADLQTNKALRLTPHGKIDQHCYGLIGKLGQYNGAGRHGPRSSPLLSLKQGFTPLLYISSALEVSFISSKISLCFISSAALQIQRAIVPLRSQRLTNANRVI